MERSSILETALSLPCLRRAPGEPECLADVNELYRSGAAMCCSWQVGFPECTVNVPSGKQPQASVPACSAALPPPCAADGRWAPLVAR